MLVGRTVDAIDKGSSGLVQIYEYPEGQEPEATDRQVFARNIFANIGAGKLVAVDDGLGNLITSAEV